MQTNYDINKEKILDDYYKCMGAFYNCSNIYLHKEKYIINKKDTEEKKLIKKGMQEDLLSNLGKVGEKAFKYIIGLENLKINPNQDEASFESLWKKQNALKDFAKKHGILETNPQFIELLNYHDENNQKSHNFHYWFCVMDLIINPISQKFEKYMEYRIQSKKLINYCKNNNEFRYVYDFEYKTEEELSLPFINAIFPNLIEFEYNFENLPFVPKRAIEVIKYSRINTIKKNGDIFTRLRYASNNNTKQQFNVDEVFELVENIISFINLIHLNNDNLNFDLNKTYSKSQALKYKKQLNISEKEINNLFDLDETGTDLVLSVFENRYTYSNIKDLLDLGISKKDLKKILSFRLYASNIKFFWSIGIYEYEKMREGLNFYIENGYLQNDIKRLIKK